MSLLLDARRKIELALEQTGAHKRDESQAPEPARSAPKAGNPLSAKADAELTPPSGAPLLRSDPAAAPARSTPKVGNPLSAKADAELAPPAGTPLLRNDPAAAGKNLFAAKPVPVRGGLRLGVIPIALISGVVIAAGWGYYVWREINPPPQALRQPPKQPPAAPIVNAVPPAQPASGPVTRENIAVVPAAIPAPPITASKAPASSPVPIPLTTKSRQGASAAFTQKKAETANKQPSILPNQEPGPSQPDASVEESKVLPAAVQAISIERGQRQNGVNPTLLAAWQAYRSGEYDLARQRYSDILKRDAKSRDALLGMAAVAQQQGQDDAAVHYYHQVLALDPRDPVAHAGLLPLLGAGHEAGMESRLKLLLAQQPQSAALHFAMGNMYAEQSRWSDAQQYYSNASSLEPDNALFVFNLAVSLDHIGKGALAAQHYQRALQLDNNAASGIDRKEIQKRLDELMAVH